MTLSSDLRRKIQALEIRAQHLVNSAFSGEYQTAFRGNGLEFRDLRDYQAGDDVRSMDWKVTARTGKPHLRSYSEERELVIYLLVDLSASTLMGQKRELILELATLLALAGGKNQDRVGLVAFSDQVEAVVPPGKGEAHLFRLVRTLLALEPRSRQTALAVALDYLNKLSPHRCVIFVLSDFLDPDCQRALARTAIRHDLTLLQIWDRLEAGQGPSALWEAQDLESGQAIWVDGVSQAGRQRFNTEAHRLALRQFCLKHRAGYLGLEARDDYFPAILRFFQLRERWHHA